MYILYTQTIHVNLEKQKRGKSQWTAENAEDLEVLEGLKLRELHHDWIQHKFLWMWTGG